ncbi:MAG TPA: alpha-amylase family glycosyl hydrolase [Gemmatimonadales bacterium]|nr:alpha-amylase family glycosyl hydrolase [Gemmatimonadales bacterium]
MDARGNVTRKRLLAIGLLGLAAAGAPIAAQAQAGASRARIAEDEVVYQIFVRSFRDGNGDRIGDLRGIQESLGYLHDLGITSLLLTPINPSPAYHNYFASNFWGVDSTFGDMAAFHSLVEAVHARGMKIYLDREDQYATGDNPWFKESLGHPDSRYSHYVLYKDSTNAVPEPIIFGLTALPSWDGTMIPVATVNLLEPGVQHDLDSLYVSLVDPGHDRRFADGVDGFRLDHMMDDLDGSPKLPHLFADFWAPLFARVRAVNPRVRLIAEQSDWGYGEDWLTRGGADMVFAFGLQRAIASFNRDSLAQVILATLAHTPRGKGQLVFIENHDMDRFASRVDGDLRREKVGAALDVLLEGTPLIYYGQEIGMKGKQSHAALNDGNDIPDREAMRWTRRLEDPGSAIWYKGPGPWWTERYNRDSDGVSVEEETHDPASLLSFYRRLLAVRRSRPEIVAGDERVVATDRPSVLAVVRSTPAAASLILVNLADSAVTASVARDVLPATLAASRLTDLLTGAAEPAPAGARRVRLPAFGVKLLARRPHH